MPRLYLGLATTFHDPALALVDEQGEVLFAEATERPLGLKRAPNCEPDAADRVAALLRRYAGPEDDLVVATSWSEEFTTLLERSAAAGAFSVEALAATSMALNRSLVPERGERSLIAGLHLMQQRAGIGALLGLTLAHGHGRVTLRRMPHHLSHAAYACRSSPFDEAVCLVVDGMGETGASAIFAYEDGRLTELKRHRGLGSIGFFFGLVTDLAGFDQTRGEEWKIMGLAPYGRRDPELLDLLRRLWREERGRLVFADEAVIQETVSKIERLRPADFDEGGWADLARCGQDVFEEMMLVPLAEARALSPSRNLVLTGGCALNSSFNGKALERAGFDALHVPSAPADDGNAVGAALLAWAHDHPDAPAPRGVLSPYLGSSVPIEPLERIAAHEPRMRRMEEAALIEETAGLLAAGKLVGWVQGRAEFGPRALGNRSILADPRSAGAKATINAKVKYREAFRPFAPAILAERGPDWFEAHQESPSMERALRWREEKRGLVPAVVHEDGTGRLQSVRRERNPRFHALIEAFDRLTGVPVLLNTSFNIMGKPILHTAEDALLMFHTTGIDVLVVEDWIMVK